jgi:hypothetical protein
MCSRRKWKNLQAPWKPPARWWGKKWGEHHYSLNLFLFVCLKLLQEESVVEGLFSQVLPKSSSIPICFFPFRINVFLKWMLFGNNSLKIWTR